MALRVTFERDPYVLTHIKGDNLSEIEAYCEENHLTIVEKIPLGTKKYRYHVYAEKPNQRMRLLRKHVTDIEGWKLIEDLPTKKMHWLTYEKASK